MEVFAAIQAPLGQVHQFFQRPKEVVFRHKSSFPLRSKEAIGAGLKNQVSSVLQYLSKQLSRASPCAFPPPESFETTSGCTFSAVLLIWPVDRRKKRQRAESRKRAESRT